MRLYLPTAFLICLISATSATVIVLATDPSRAPWYIFVLLSASVFSFVFTSLGLSFYFLRTKVHGKAYLDKKWFVKTSFKLSFFMALFVALALSLSFLKIANTFNVTAVFLAVGLLAIWTYLGKK